MDSYDKQKKAKSLNTDGLTDVYLSVPMATVESHIWISPLHFTHLYSQVDKDFTSLEIYFANLFSSRTM